MRLSPETEADLRDILRYTLETWGAQHQDDYDASIRAAFDQLARFPSRGRVLPGTRAGTRRYRVEQHVIRSEADKDEGRIGRIVHLKMESGSESTG